MSKTKKQLLEDNKELRERLKASEYQFSQLVREVNALKGIEQKKSIAHPHDTGYKSLLSRKSVFLQLLRRFLPRQWVEGLDEDSLINVNKSFVMPDFRKKELDIIYMGKMRGRDVIFYCLMELQSTVDPLMPLRLLLYMGSAWNNIAESMSEEKRLAKGVKIPLIIPVVLYNGTEVWDVPLNFREIIDFDIHFMDILDDILNFSYELINVHSYSEKELLNKPEIISMIFLLDQVKEPVDIFSRLRKLAGNIRQMIIEEYRILASWIEHILSRNLSEEDKKNVHNILVNSKPKEVNEMISNVERVLEKQQNDIIKATWEKAEKVIWEKAKKEFAIAALKKGSDVDYVASITGLDPAEILKLQQDI